MLLEPRPSERLEHLRYFGLHHQLDVHRHLAERASDEPQERADFGDAVAHRVPGDGRLAEPKLMHQAGLRFHGALLERRERAARTAKFTDQHARS